MRGLVLLLLLRSQPPSSAASLQEADAEDAPAPPTAVSLHEAAPPTAVSLHEAAAQDDGKLVYKLFAEGSPTDTLDENKMTPLMLASYLGATDAIAALLHNGAALEAWVPGVRMTPLHWAASQGQAEAAGMLLARGGALEARDVGERTPLHFASVRGHEDVVQLLLEAGASHKAQSKLGVTPLQMAAERERPRLSNARVLSVLSRTAQLACPPAWQVATWQRSLGSSPLGRRWTRREMWGGSRLCTARLRWATPRPSRPSSVRARRSSR
jgi:ankyrin repeat protein